MERRPLKVCVCGAVRENTTLWLHSLAAGDVLGNNHLLQLTLQDSAFSGTDLQDEAQSLNDACYPALMGGVRAERSVSKSVSDSDVVFLLLGTAGLENRLSVMARYATALSNTARTKQKAVVVVGGQASTAVGVLYALASHLSPHLLCAVDLPVSSNVYPQNTGSTYTYHVVNMVTAAVRSWWIQIQEAETSTTALNFRSLQLPSMPSTSCSLALPILMVALQSKERLSWAGDREDVKQVVRDLSTAVELLGVSRQQLLTSLVSSHL